MNILNYKESEKNRDVVSLFSGAMGLDLGLDQAGLNIVVGQDFEKSCVETIRRNGHKVLGGDIRAIGHEQVLAESGLQPGEPFLVCGGPPCQPFSTAGKRLGINDPRGSLFMDFIRMIDKIRPRFFIMENVKGLISSPLKTGDGPRNSNSEMKVLDIILSEFKKLNYKTTYGILDAVNYGTPQFRERFILVGSRDNENIFLPFPTHFQTHQRPENRWNVLRNAIGDLEDNPGEGISFSEERMNLLKLVPEGGNWKDLPMDLVESAMGGAFTSGGGKVGFYRRLSYSQPSPTLVTSPVQKASMLCHPTQNRPLSVREYARIQQFPDDWVFAGTVSEKYRQIGNAVPVGLSTALGQAVIAVAEGNETIKTKRTRGTDIHNRISKALSMGGD